MIQDSVLTNILESEQVDFNALQSTYRAFCIRFEGREYGANINLVREIISPLSVAYEYGRGNYYVMLKSTQEIEQDEKFTAQEIQFANIPLLLLHRLLIRAIPHILDKAELCEADGLYYKVASKKLRAQLYYIAAELEWQKGFNEQELAITINTKVFSPLSLHEYNGVLPKNIARLPRFDVSSWEQTIKRSYQGKYVKKSFKFCNHTIDACDISSNDFLKFRATKVGVLATFLEDVHAAYGDIYKIRFKRSSSSYRNYITEKNVKNEYQHIQSLLCEKEITIVNNIANTKLAELLKNSMEEQGYRCVISDKPELTSPNILLVHDPLFYEERNIEDPYKRLKKLAPQSQAAISTKLFITEKSETLINESVLTVILKELLIKHEITSRTLQIKPLSGDWGFVVPESKYDGNGERIELIHWLRVTDSKLKFETLDSFEWSEKEALHYDVDTDKAKHIVLNYTNSAYYEIQESNVFSIPEFEPVKEVLEKVHSGQEVGISRSFIEQYISSEIDHDNSKSVDLMLKLENILSSHQFKNTFEVKSLSGCIGDKSFKLAYQGAAKHFYDWLDDVHGITLKASLRSQKDGYFNAHLGVFYDSDSGYYFVGNKGTSTKSKIARFSRIRKIITNQEVVPESFFELFESTYVRHREPSVYPYPFKILNEIRKIGLNKCH